jgi:hypothetical protein
MTFKENMDIPRSMNIFYDQAFNTLFTWHDATKAFSRRKVLDIDEFRKAFSVFCLLSYYDQKYEFTEAEVFTYIRKTNQVLSIKAKESDLLKDFGESVNLMQQDGLKYIFIHRSFQEYFAALALVGVLQDKIAAFLKVISTRVQDSVLQIAYEMNSELITQEYVVPNYEKFIKPLPKRDTVKEPGRLMAVLEVEYRVTRHKPLDRGPSSSLSMRKLPGAFPFMMMVQRLKDMLVGAPVETPGFGHDTNPIHPFLLHAVDRAAKKLSIDITEQIECSVKFVADGPVATLVSSHDHDVTEAIRTELQRGIPLLAEALIPLTSKLRRDVEMVRRWAEERISESQKRAESIDSILGL